MKILITVCARGGSKGIPGKNIKEIGGKPLIYYTLKTANAFKAKYDTDIIISTDSAEIKDVVINLGFPVTTDYTRPDALATDATGKLDVIKDALRFAEDRSTRSYDYIMDLDVTSPLRNVEDLSSALETLETSEAVNIFSVSPAHRNPYFNMVEENSSGFYDLCKKGQFLTRQSAPKVYDLNASFCIFKKSFFQQDCQHAITDRTIVYEVPHLCFDLDNPLDFDFMEFIFTRKLDFEF